MTRRVDTLTSDDDLALYARSFVDWSQSPLGFRPGKRYDYTANDWKDSRDPILWVERQARILRHALTYDEAGRLPYEEIWWIDIGKSGKTMLSAAVVQWMGMFGRLKGEILIAANAKEQSKSRAFRTLMRSLETSPVPDVRRLPETHWAGTVEWNSGIIATAAPLKAQSQSGADSPLVVMDEVWGYTSEAAMLFLTEAKASPTLNVSLRLITTYPGYKQDKGPLNDALAEFFDEEGALQPGVERIPTLEDLPAYRKGGTLLWWNHDPYPWHSRDVGGGVTWLERERKKVIYRSRPEEYLRIWEARLVSREDSFVAPAAWYACEDDDHNPVGPHEQGVRAILGLDIGVYRDSTAAVLRGLDPATGRYPLLEHKIWRPRASEEDPERRPEVYLPDVLQWIADRLRRYEIIALYYDETQASLLGQMLREEIRRGRFSTRLEVVEQGKRRETADMAYVDLITTGTLRNYPQCADLTQHVLDATRRYTRGGHFRIDKAQGIHNDAAVADAMACLGVTENQARFQRPRARPASAHKVPNAYRRAYQGV